MKLKQIALLMGLSVCLVLAGCSKKPVETEDETPNTVEQNNEIVKETDEKEDDSEGQEDIEKYAVEGNVTVKISKFIQRENPETFNEAAFLRENDGFVAAQVDKDGVLTVRISNEKKEELSESLKGGLDAVLDGLVTNMDTPFVKKVDVVEDYKQVTIAVDKVGYEEWINQGLDLVDLILIPIGSYQTYSDIEFNTEITIKDETTGDVLFSEKYPEKLEEDLKAAEEATKETKNNRPTKLIDVDKLTKDLEGQETDNE